MHSIKLLGIVRRIEREAARRGLNSDCTIEDPMLPDTGTINQQFSMAAVGLDADIRLGDLSTRERELVSQLVQNCVLGSPYRQSRPDVASKMQREWRRKR